MKKPALKTVLATDIIQVHVHLKEHYMYHHGTTLLVDDGNILFYTNQIY